MIKCQRKNENTEENYLKEKQNINRKEKDWREELTIAIIKCKYILSKKGPKDLWITQEVSKTIKDIKKKKKWNEILSTLNG